MHVARLFLIPGLAVGAAAGPEVSWEPVRPSTNEAVTIRVRGASQGGVVHWGANGRKGAWEQPIPAYRPTGSRMDGIAVRTDLGPADSNQVRRCLLGPFNEPSQAIASVPFVIQWDDGTWDNNAGKDYRIRIGELRVQLAPATATWNEEVVITVRDSRHGGVLHWGVNAVDEEWQSPHPVYHPDGTKPWRLSDAVETPLPPPNAEGNSVIRLGPFHHGEQVVTSLHCVVRWNKVWETDDGSNYNARIVADSTAAIPVIDISEPVTAGGSAALWLDGEPFGGALPTRMTYGPHIVTARSGTPPSVGLAHTSFWVLPEVVEAALPVGARSGAGVSSDGFTRFVLFAPGKKFVELDVQGEERLLMQKDPGGYWWIDPALPEGTYRYRYVVDGHLFIADPYAIDVDWQDERGEESANPTQAYAVVQIGQPGYVWSTSSFERPDWNRLFIYELFVEDLCPGEGFRGVIDRLDEIQALGCNAIEPLPIMEWPGELGWGYNPAFHLAPESVYGTPDDLRALIDACHVRGMAFIVDLVLNHTARQGPLNHLYGQDYEASPYFRRFEGDNWGFPDLDQDAPALQKYAADVVAFWLREYRVDGFRYDATRWTGWSMEPLTGAALFATAAKAIDPTSYQIAEHLPEEAALVNDTPMDAQWDATFRWRLRDMLVKQELDPEVLKMLLDVRQRGSRSNRQRVLYTESHDEERVFGEMVEATGDLTAALDRSLTALVFTLTAPGPAMIYAGQEFAVFDPKVVGPNPLPHHQAELPPFARFRDTVARLGALKTQHPAMEAEQVEWIRCDGDAGIALYRMKVGEDQIQVAANFGSAPASCAVDLSADGAWMDVLSGAEANPGIHSIALRPGASAVFATRSL